LSPSTSSSIAHEEQVQVAEEALEAAVLAVVVVHVADRVDVDQRAHAGHDQAHHDRQRIEQERHLGDDVAGADPRVDLVDERDRGARQRRGAGRTPPA
jgi:hypothetical protein